MPRSAPPLRFAFLLVLALLLGGCTAFYGLVFPEAAELAAEGREIVLRSEMRPIRGETRVLLFGIDGVGADVFYRALREGNLPNVSRLVGPPVDTAGLWAYGYGAPDVLSVLPAETVAGWAATFTGAPPAVSGVPGNEWFVRDSLRFFAPVPISVGGLRQTLQIYTEDLLGQQLADSTVYERAGVRAHAAQPFVYRGADLLTPPDLVSADNLIGSLIKGVVQGELFEQLYRELDYGAVTGFQIGARNHGLPDLQVVYFPGTDLLAHTADSALVAQRAYLRDEVDDNVGKVLDEYRKRGALDRTYVLFVADHGHTDVLDDSAHALEEQPRRVLEDLGLRVRPFSQGADSSGAFDAVVAYNEAFAFLYLADRTACRADYDDPEAVVCDWRPPPRLREDVLPVAQAFWEANRDSTSGMAGTLDLILVREPRPLGTDDAPYDGQPYQIYRDGQLFPLADHLPNHDHDDLPRFEERLRWLAEGPLAYRAGDVLLLAKAGPAWPLEERYYFAAPHLSGHGSASAQDGTIPLLVAQPRTPGWRLRDEVHDAVGPNPTQLSVTPLVVDLLRRNRLR